MLDFEMVPYDETRFQYATLTNIGKVNLQLYKMMVNEGTFKLDTRECMHFNASLLFPGQQCLVSTQFFSREVGERQGVVSILSNAVNSPLEISLQGSKQPPVKCAEEKITLTSIQSGAWGNGETWDLGHPPTENDVIKINPDHIVAALPETMVKTLCIAEGGILESADHRGTSLIIHATNYIENRGTVRGQHGADEVVGERCSKEKLGQGDCAYPGASIFLMVEGPLLNQGFIMGGQGGKGTQYAARGGNTIVFGRNAINEKTILAGNGGDLLGTQSGEAGQGGSIQLRGNVGGNVAGPGPFYNYGEIKAGSGGNCHPQTIETQIGGEGGHFFVTSSGVYLYGTQETGNGGICSGKQGRKGGRMFIDPSMISLAGSNTKVEGEDITIFGGKDWVLDLSNLSHPVVKAQGNLTLAVGEGGMIDLRGSASSILQAEGQVNLFSDGILLDEGRQLAELITAKEIVVGPSKILKDVSLVGPAKVNGLPGATMPIRFILSNNGPEKDTYLLEVSDTKGWSRTPLSSPVSVEGLETLTLESSVTLPMIQGEQEVIQVTATSQEDPTISSRMVVMVEVEGSDRMNMTSVVLDPPPPVLPVLERCSTTGTLNSMCDNRWQTITDASFGPRATLSGGELAGTIDNQGFISQVTLQAGSVLKGGTLSGTIVNHGRIEEINFVGLSLQGGILAGKIFNLSRVGGTLVDVRLAPHTQIVGGKMKGEIQGDEKAPAWLENVRILAGSRLSGVSFGQGVVLEEHVTVKAVEDAGGASEVSTGVHGNQ